MQLHNLLTSNLKEDSFTLPKSTPKLPDPRSHRKKVKSATMGEVLLKEIQCMIIS